MLEVLLGQEIDVARDDWRPGDQRIFVADIRKSSRELGWQPLVTTEEGIRRLYEWVVANNHLFKSD
jgi:CDP-paratose 2-epimerase